MCKSYPERQLQKFVERLCTTTICKNRKHEKEFAKSAKNFSQRNLQKDCLEQQFAKILSRTTICQKWLSGMAICTKTNFGTIICTKWSIATICKNIVINTNLQMIGMEKIICKVCKQFQEILGMVRTHNNLQWFIRMCK